MDYEISIHASETFRNPLLNILRLRVLISSNSKIYYHIKLAETQAAPTTWKQDKQNTNERDTIWLAEVECFPVITKSLVQANTNVIFIEYNLKSQHSAGTNQFFSDW